ncbi:T9SS type A sorting domain-containing protein [Pinibacter soli]|uniref:T9SS type A sorting domain-containing protein n=1 Tax=Pinibacter soli TaxID=3044211 RepID=A0ABT6R8Q3_9BACT|nr:T9SS type A sorting domain-containing protein [Pinibacter soli]MDI3318941.1 T9SS type A sorting domain-containing protein [Pinibacter soli]
MKVLLRILCIAVIGMYAPKLNAQIPILNSYPSAKATVYLDFDGQYVTGTSWNWDGPIDAQPSGLANDQITEIFNRISEDYRPFNLNITTDSTVYAKAPLAQRIRVIFTPTSAWYGSAGGVSFVGSFTWGNGTPSFVFNQLLNNVPKYVAESASHEIGHTLGLQHQSTYDANGNKLSEYNGGQGTGEIGWAPIMGVGYYKNQTTWHYGTSTQGALMIQSDLDIISGTTNNFGYRTDDVGNTMSKSTVISTPDAGFTASGLINSATDVDVFKVTFLKRNSFNLTAVPQNVGANDEGANIDIKVALLNAKGDTLNRYNPSLLLNAGIDTTLDAGAYYLVVDGVSNVNHSEYGSLGYYTLIAKSSLATLPLHNLQLKGSNNNGIHQFTWAYEADERVSFLAMESSADGAIFTELTALATSARSFSYKPLTDGTLMYRIKAITANEQKTYYSNVVSIKQAGNNDGLKIWSNIITSSLKVTSSKAYNYQVVDLSGRVLAKGITTTGTTNIQLPATATGMLFFTWNDGTSQHSEKLIKQ